MDNLSLYPKNMPYLYEAMQVPFQPHLDFPCIYGGHCGSCPSKVNWDMAIGMQNLDGKVIAISGTRENGQRTITFVLFYQNHGNRYPIKNGEKTFLMPECLHGLNWLLDFVRTVQTDAILNAEFDFERGKPWKVEADWDFKSVFPDWDTLYMSRYYLTEEEEA